MTKRQWFLVAGLLAVAACNPLNGLEVCPETQPETDESFCYTRSEADRAQNPAPAVETPETEESNP